MTIRTFFSVLCIVLLLLFGSEIQAKSFAKKIKNGGSAVATLQNSDKQYVTVQDLGCTSIPPFIPQICEAIIRNSKSTGVKVWETRLQISLPNNVARTGFNGIAQTTDGGYILVGHELTFEPVGPIYFAIAVKLTPDGSIEWTKRYSTGFAGRFSFTSVIGTSDGGFMATGEYEAGLDESLTLFASFDSSGRFLSAKHSAGMGRGSLIGSTSGAFLVANKLEAISISESKLVGPYVTKLNKEGKIDWKKVYKADGCKLHSVSATTDHGGIIQGLCEEKDLFLIKIKSDGQVEWNKRFAFEGSPVVDPKDVTQTSQGDYLVTGSIENDLFIFKTNSSGDAVYAKTFGDKKRIDTGHSIFGTPNGGALLFGAISDTSSRNDTLILKLNSSGAVSGCGQSGTLRFSSVPFGNLKIGVPKSKLSKESLLESNLAVKSEASDNALAAACR